MGARAVVDREGERKAAAERAGPVHVHGLGVNPADGALYVATHTGMWRVQDGGEPEPVGDSLRDTMGFTVAGPDHFLGSGHPDNPHEPRLLGLIESRDAGETWSPVSLSGEADFHVLRLARGRLYGYDAAGGRLLLSRDRGRSWEALRAPAPIGDLAVSPADPLRLLTATEEGTFASRDGGRTWRPASAAVGYLAWPAPTALLLLRADGALLASGDAGATWSPRGDVGGGPSALLAVSTTELYAAVHEGAIRQSRDGGRTWATVGGS